MTGTSITYTTEHFCRHMLVKLAKDDPHVVALWTEGHACEGEWTIGTSQGAENIRAPQAPSQELCLSCRQGNPSAPAQPSPLWGQLPLAPAASPPGLRHKLWHKSAQAGC